MFYPEGEFLFEYGDLNGDVYFISKGLVATYTERGDIMSYVGSGSIIGEISCLFEVQRQYSTVAATDIEVYMFRKEDFLDFLSLYPNLKATLETACIRHYKETMEAVDQSAGIKVILGTSTEDARARAGAINKEEGQGLSDFRQRIVDFADTHTIIAEEDGRASGVGGTVSTKSSDGNDQNHLAVVEMDFGTAKEIPVDECEKDPEFIYDPLRPPVTVENDHWMLQTGIEQIKHWSSFFVSFGKLPRDEMGLLHIMTE